LTHATLADTLFHPGNLALTRFNGLDLLHSHGHGKDQKDQADDRQGRHDPAFAKVQTGTNVAAG
jgi:hypothetical protein